MPAGFRLAIVVLMLPILLFASPMTASAQETPTPIPQGYRSGRAGYASEFNEVLGQLDAYWFSIFSQSANEYHAPGVVAVTASIVTSCGPASPADFAS